MSEAKRVPSYLLELAAAGELPVEERRSVVERAASEGAAADPIAALERDAQETLGRLPPERFAAEIARRVLSPRRPRRRGWILVPALTAMSAAVVGGLVRPRPASPPVTAPDETRVKGLAPHLVVHRRTPAGAERIGPGTPVRPGDLVQLGYVAAGQLYGVIVSVDGGGAVTRHWPIDGARAAALESGREVLLPESFRLDAAPRFERFFLVTSERPFDVAGALESARALAARADSGNAPLPLPPGLHGADVLLPKESR
jgi:hypothetical protein